MLLLFALPPLVVSAVATISSAGEAVLTRKQDLPAGTSDTVQTPPAGLSSAEPPVVAGLQIGAVVLGDASAGLWQDRST